MTSQILLYSIQRKTGANWQKHKKWQVKYFFIPFKGKRVPTDKNIKKWQVKYFFIPFKEKRVATDKNIKKCQVKYFFIPFKEKPVPTDKNIKKNDKSSTSLFHRKENVGATHELQTNKETVSTCIKDSQFKSAE